jgi:hypothetical protein
VPLGRIEIVKNGEVIQTLKPENKPTKLGAYESSIKANVAIDESSWIVVRCFEDRPDKRVRFAHTAPFHIDVAGQPLRPRRAEVDYLIKSVENQLTRSRDVLPEAALAEYREALREYQALAKAAR